MTISGAEPITIRRAADPATATTLLDWAAEEGWNPGRHDAEAFFAADTHGWWLAETADGTPVGGLSLVLDDSGAFAFLGLYIVRPQWRGQGIGLRVWRAALEASPAACIGLDGVVVQQANYARSGFALAFRNQRFRGDAAALAAPASMTERGMVPLAEVPRAAVADLDRAVAYPGHRAAFLRRWSAPPDGAALGLMRDGALRGVGVIRRCREGHKIGPLIADGPAEAHSLIGALCHRAGGGAVFLDVPHANPAALALARALDLEPVFETARMYRGTPAPLDHGRLFGVTTFELG